MKKTKGGFLAIVVLVIIGVFYFFGVKSARAISCWCQNTKTGVCDDTQGPDPVDKNAQLVCDANADHSCDSYCKGRSMLNGQPVDVQLHCDPEPPPTDWNTVSAGDVRVGCMPAQCWCKKKDNSCENPKTDDKGNLFLNTSACNSYCSSKGESAIHFDSSGTVYSQNVECQPNKIISCTCNNGSCQPSNVDGQCQTGCAPSNCALQAVAKTTSCVCADNSCTTPNSFTGQCPAGCKSGPCVAPPVDKVGELKNQAAGLNQMPNFSSPQQVIGQVIKILTAFMGPIALILYIYAGFLWMIAAGNSERTEHAKLIFVWTTLGVLVILASYILVSTLFVFVGTR